ncbi:MAG: gliding motility-associated C-terminal domain-containing protein [Lewinellaceae bacterium]|nr:gliding motility-associated C-terminal domain-containing protein [Lewinellaceae bacterium]
MTIEKIKNTMLARHLYLVIGLVLCCVASGLAQGPNLFLSFTPPSCNGDSDGIATVLAIGGQPPYSYLWSNLEQTPSISGLSAGNYTVTVTDTEGNSTIGTAQLLEPGPLQFNVTVTNPSCNGSPGAMTVFPTGGTPPFNILWSNGVVGASANNLEPGVAYTVEATDLHGCQADTTVFIPEIDSLNINLIIKKAECVGVNDGSATAVVIPSGGSYSYQWNVNNANTPQITNLAAGTFVAVTVTETNSGCIGLANGIIGTHTQLNLNLIADTMVTCFNEMSAAATATASNGTPLYSYAWSGPNGFNATGPMISNLGVGSYAVTATDSRGCTVAGGVNVTFKDSLNADFSIDKSCVANQFIVDIVDHSTATPGPIVSWQWNITWDGGGSFTSNQQNIPMLSIPNQSTGVAQLIVTSAAGCSDTLIQAFKVDSLLDYEVQTQGYSCDSSAVPITVIGDPNFTYNWQPDSFLIFNPDKQNVLADPPTTKTYILVVSNNTCFDSKMVTITRQPLLELEATGDSICGGTGVLTATTNVPGSIVWTNLNGDTINPLMAAPGTYIAIARDNAYQECVRMDTVEVVDVGVNVTATVPNAACPGMLFDLVAQNNNPGDNVTYQWTTDPATLTIADPASAMTTASGPVGTYTVTLVINNQYPCFDTLTFPVQILDSIRIDSLISVKNACVSLTIEYTNNSSYNGTWNFGDGVGTSTLNNGTYTYGAPGTYTVTFTPEGDCVLPVAKEIEPDSVSFTVVAPDITTCSTSASLSATPSKPATLTWTTMAGDTVSNPNMVGAGQYIVTAVSLDGQCTATDMATVILDMVVDISDSVSVTEDCISLTVSYNNSSSHDGTWNFGDGVGTSILNSGTYTYGAPGTYTVTFTPNDTCVIAGPMTVQPDSVPFTVTAPDIMTCADSASLSATPSKPATLTWTTMAGDTVLNPNMVGAGQYIVTAVSLDGQCTATDMATVILDMVVDISDSVSVTEDCISLTVSYNNSSSHDGTWNFGDGVGTSVLNNGTYTYGAPGTYTVTFTPNDTCVIAGPMTVQPDSVPFTVTAPDIMTCADSASLSATPSKPATLTWTTMAGDTVSNPNMVGAGQYIVTAVSLDGQCTATDMATVILDMVVDISDSVSVTEDCISLTVSYNNSSSHDGTWNFGDGVGTSVLNNGTYTYGAPGTYTVTFTPNDTCVIAGPMTVQPDSVPFTVTAPDIMTCADSASLSATPSKPATLTWTTMAGDTVLNPNMVGAGQYIVTAVSLDGQCTATDMATVILDMVVDISDSVSVTEDCISLTVSYNNSSSHDGTWNFGDGVGTSVLNSGTYTYGAPGTYTVIFTPNDTCVIAGPMTVQPDSVPFTVTAPDIMTCADSASLSATPSKPATLTWTTMAGDTVLNPNMVGAGQYIVTAVSLDGQCTATDMATVILDMVVDISDSVSVTEDCISLTVSYNNSSSHDGTWNFGDGVGTSVLNNGTYTYGAPGTYTVTFTPNDTCVIAGPMTVQPDSVPFTVTAPDIMTCADSASLSATPSKPATLTWTTMAGDTVLNPNMVGAGQYIVTAVSLDGQCTATDMATVILDMVVDISDSVSVTEDCISLTVSYNNSSSHDGTWNFGDGVGTSVLNNGTYTYGAPGTYTVTFTPNDTCVIAGPMTVQPDSVPFTVTAPDIMTCADSASLSATPSKPATLTWTTMAGDTVLNPNMVGAGQYIVTAVSLDGQCTATDMATVILDMVVDISDSVSVTEDCISLTVSYNNSSSHDGTWNFGDGVGTSVLNNGTYTYGAPGTYTVTFTPNDTCVIAGPMTVQPDSVPFTVTAPDIMTCADSASLSATPSKPATLTWTTMAGDTVLNPNMVGAGQYIVTAVSLDGQCTATDMATVILDMVVDISDSVSVTEDCISLTVSYNNSSSHDGTWNFGDGVGTSVLNNGTYTYGAPGTYTVTFTPNDTCVIAGPMTVQPDSVPFTVTAPDIMTCADSASLSATPSKPATLTWTTMAGDTVLNPNMVGAGQYIVTAVSLDGQCTATDMATVILDMVVDISDSVSVTEDCISLTVSYNNSSSHDGTWNFGDGVGTSVLNNGTYTYGAPGTYTVTFTPNDTCVIAGPMTVQPDSVPFTVTAPDIMTCADSASLSATPSKPATLTWTTMAGDTVLNPNMVGAGQYIVTAVSLDGQCTATDMATVILDMVVDISDSVSVTEDCISLTVSYNNSSSHDGTWNFGDGVGTSVLNNGTYTYGAPGTYTVTFTPNDTCVIAGPMTVQPDSVPFTVTAPDIMTCADSASLSATPSKPATLTWTTMAGDTVLNPNMVGAGQYIVTAVSLDGQCTATDMATVILDMVVDISDSVSVTEDCISLTVSYNNSSSHDGTWNFGDGVGTSVLNNGTYTYGAPGTYTVTFTPNDTCVIAGPMTVQPDSVPFTVTAPDIMTCADSASLSATPSKPATLTWTTMAGDTVSNPNMVGAGQYIVTAVSLDGQCTATDMATVEIINFMLILDDIISCDSTAGLRATTNLPATILWADINGIPVPDSTMVLSGQYIAIATTLDSLCMATDTISVMNLNFKVTAQDITTCDSTASLMAMASLPASIFWTDINGSPVPDPTMVISGQYIAIATTFDSLCTDVDTATVITLNFMVTGNNGVVCDSTETAGLTATINMPGEILGWTNLAGDPVPDPTAVGTGQYIVTAIDETEACMATDTVEVTNEAAMISLAPEYLICQNEEVELMVTNEIPAHNLTYAWTNNLPAIANPVVSPMSLTTYTVTVTNQYGCTDVAVTNIDVVVVTVTAEVDGSDTICTGQFANLKATAGGNAGFYTYLWSPSGTLSGADTAEPVATPTQTQTYTVTVTGDDLCTATGSVTIFFRETQCAEPYIFVPKAFTPNGDGNNDFFRVRGTDQLGIRRIYFIVYNRWGEEVYKTEQPIHQGWDGTFRGKSATPDSYGWYLEVECNDDDNVILYKTKGNVTLLR